MSTPSAENTNNNDRPATGRVRKAELDHNIDEVAAALGLGFKELKTSVDEARQSIDRAREEAEPIFELRREVGAAMTGAGAGVVVGAGAGAFLATRDAAAGGVILSRTDVAGAALKGAAGGAVVGAALGGLVARLSSTVTKAAAKLRSRPVTAEDHGSHGVIRG